MKSGSHPYCKARQGASRVDKYVKDGNLVGVPLEVAEKAGVSVQAVYDYIHRHGIRFKRRKFDWETGARAKLAGYIADGRLQVKPIVVRNVLGVTKRGLALELLRQGVSGRCPSFEERIERFLASRPDNAEKLTSVEVATACGVNRSSVKRLLKKRRDLRAKLVPRGGRRW